MLTMVRTDHLIVKEKFILKLKQTTKPVNWLKTRALLYFKVATLSAFS